MFQLRELAQPPLKRPFRYVLSVSITRELAQSLETSLCLSVIMEVKRIKAHSINSSSLHPHHQLFLSGDENDWPQFFISPPTAAGLLPLYPTSHAFHHRFNRDKQHQVHSIIFHLSTPQHQFFLLSTQSINSPSSVPQITCLSSPFQSRETASRPQHQLISLYQRSVSL